MTRMQLILRNLWHFRGANLAIVAGMAVATAVLAGALMVGDSVRGSLREMALQRLGPIDHALVSTRFFGEDLAKRIAATPQFGQRFEACTVAISLRGGAANEAGTARTAGVQIHAVDGENPAKPKAGQAILNGELAELLDVGGAGRTVLLTLPTADDMPRDATLARRSRTDVTTGLRVQVQQVAQEPGMLSLFSLTGTQRMPRNAWVNLKELQDAIGQRQRANLLLVRAKSQQTGPDATTALNRIVREVTRLGDYGLTVGPSHDGVEAVINSTSTYIPEPIDQAAEEAAKAVGTPLRRVLVYLANKATKVEAGTAKPAAIHYSIVAGISDVEGKPLGADEIALNEWTAEQLEAKVGDRIRLAYYERQSNGELREVSSDRDGVALTFRVARIIPMRGLGADATLTPEYKGFTDADSIADWESPQGVEINKKLVTPADEEYWNKYKAAPKLFVNLDTAKKLWGGTYGDLTSIRVPAEKGEAFAAALRDRLDPATLGLAFVPIKAQQLAGASGSTDFAGLFIGFSFFLIVAAALLVAMLFRLGVEQRARQLGLLGALGFGPRTLHRLALAEGLLLAAVGGLAGVGLGIGYTWLMVYGLRTWWVDAVGTTMLRLHVEPMTLTIGWVASSVIALGIILWAVRRVSRTGPAVLLAGGWGQAAAGQARGSKHLPGAGRAMTLLGAMGFIGLGLYKPQFAQGAFLGGGGLLLVAGLLFAAARLRSVNRQQVATGAGALMALSFRNAARHRARSVLTLALIAFASFALVTVASMRQSAPAAVEDKNSGTGGYSLILQAEVPLQGDLNTVKGRDLLGIRETDSPLWQRAGFTPLRSWAGQDISCLNLTRPSSPTILAVPESMIQRQAFTFAGQREPVENPWRLLEEKAGLHDESDAIPVIADAETATYILKLGIGDTLPLTDQLGRPRTLRLVATLSHSIFQGELLMSEGNFQRLFPTQSGFGTVLVEASRDELPELRRLLATELEDFAVTVENTGDRLARYQQVANTYLSTFQVLGSLGLMLGTIGLAVVLLRNLIERRAELALLAAMGFRPRARLQLVLAENAYLLVAGLAIGSVSALIAVLPARRALNVTQLALTLGVTLLLGLSVLAVATVWAGRRMTPGDLRAE